MQVEFLERFHKDLDKIQVAHVKEVVRKTILKVESANSLSELTNLKKLSGHKHAYRIKIGDYRIGLYIENSIVEFARVIHRKDIYNVFP